MTRLHWGVLKRAVACIGMAFVACSGGADSALQTQGGGDVSIQAGRSITLPTGLAVGFEAVVTDSRCPSDAQCIAAGDATVRITAADRGETPRRFELHTDEDPREATHGHCKLTVVALKPLPTSSRPVRPEEYVLTLKAECS